MRLLLSVVEGDEAMKRKRENGAGLALTRQKILDAAAAEFAEGGLAGARVDRIGLRAGVNKAMIYYIFKSKEQLHLSVLEALFEEKTRGLDETGELRIGSRAELIAMLGRYLDAFMARGEYARIMVGDVVTGGQGLRALRKKRPDLFAVFDKISDALEGLADKGAIRQLDPDKSVMTVILLLASLSCSLQHMDLVRKKGGPAHRSLSDPTAWREFLAQALSAILAPE